MAYNLGKIKELIEEALTTQELADLCFGEFRTVYKDFDGQTQSSRIRSLVDHAHRYGQIDKLLKEIEQINPYRYNEYLARIGMDIYPPQPAPAIVTPRMITSLVAPIVPTKCILVLAANPAGTDKLDLAAEANKIGARLQEGVQGKDYFVRFLEQSIAENLDRYLLEYKPVIVHFVGHGNSRGEMLFQNDRNEPQAVTPSAFANLFALVGETVECVVLNSCFSLEMAEALQPHVRCTIGMNAKIDDESAGKFAGGFYRGLAFGKGYYQAFELGCSQIELLNLPDVDVPIFNTTDSTVRYESKRERVTRSDEKQVNSGEDDKATLYPVWYGTNRKLVDRENVSQGFGGERDDRIHYGCCQVAVPKSHKIGSTGSSWWKRWLQRSDDRLTLDRSSLKLLNETNFLESIKSALQERELGERSALVFIHGFNVSFESAAIQAAQIGVDLQVPGIMAFYSWPSLGRPTGYAADGATIEASEKYITEFLVNLAENDGIDKIHIIAHSMGNRGLLRAMQRILAQVDATNPSISFGQIFLAAPDVDVDTFQDLAVAYQHLAERTTLYVSDKDKALKASRIINNFPRAGFFPPVRTYAEIDTIQVSNIDVTWLGHGYISEAKEVLQDMHKLLMENTPPKKRFGMEPLSTKEDRPYWQIGK
jgi:esterase/lipase superfamily enzyme